MTLEQLLWRVFALHWHSHMLTTISLEMRMLAESVRMSYWCLCQGLSERRVAYNNGFYSNRKKQWPKAVEDAAKCVRRFRSN